MNSSTRIQPGATHCNPDLQISGIRIFKPPCMGTSVRKAWYIRKIRHLLGGHPIQEMPGPPGPLARRDLAWAYPCSFDLDMR